MLLYEYLDQEAHKAFLGPFSSGSSFSESLLISIVSNHRNRIQKKQNAEETEYRTNSIQKKQNTEYRAPFSYS